MKTFRNRRRMHNKGYILQSALLHCTVAHIENYVLLYVHRLIQTLLASEESESD